MTERQMAKFWNKVDLSNPGGCWPWTGWRNRDGYGEVRVGGRIERAHRVAYQLASGETLPAGVVVRHACNNARCCNPAHLALGSHADNVADRVRAGHSASGERNGRAKLTAAAVRMIRRLLAQGERASAIASTYGVSPRAVSQIGSGETWQGVA
jgi:hypothetical protein